ncbi:MAG TPA: FGGY family carbohydrate kinase [Streptosporangiaceae bacterium]|nr:FGGY family carbohydrate kinase [Streptosporangiaceae bacterium]
MPAAEVLVAVDVGTSGARASAFEVSGAPGPEVRRSYPTFLPAEGWAEQDAGRWRSAALSALGGLVRALGPWCRVRAVAVTGQCPSVVPLDRRDRPLRAGLIYRDNRATAEADRLRERFGDRKLHELTGHVPAAFHVAAKIAWLRAHEPDVFAATRRYVQPADYVALALTGESTTDWSMAAATALLDQRARRWAPDLLASLDLDESAFPAVVPSWSVAGEIRPAVARRLGLPDGVPVVAGAGDSIACALGAGVTAVSGSGPVSEMAGSSSCFNSVVPEPLPDLDVTHYPSITSRDGYVTEVGINTTGEALDWLATLFYAGSGPGSRAPRPSDYARLEKAAAAAPPGAGGLVFAPVLGDGERDDPALRGAITGLSLRHDRGAVARAALEGIACAVRARLETLARTSAPATELRVSGGGAGLAVWNQIKADVTGIPVERVAGDSTAAGAAMLAGLGAGIYRDAAEAVAAGYRPAGRAEPDPAHRALFDDLYARYTELLGSRVVR